MALTNFAALTTEEKTVWSRDLWKQARNMSFVNKFVGNDANSMIQRISELTKDEKGARAVITLVADLEGDGVAGDNTLEGNEEPIKSYDQVIQIDQLRHANRHKGRMADQRSVVNFRNASKDVLAYWLADRIDQLAFLTLSGVAYSFKTNGAARSATSAFTDLAFAADVTAPSTNRYFKWDAVNGLEAPNTASHVTADTPSYKMLVDLKSRAKEEYIRGIRGPGGQEYFHVFMSPRGMSKLKLDADYLANLRNGANRGGTNPLFTGEAVTVDGLILHEYRHVFTTLGIAGGSKWGGGAVDGQKVLFCGAQALGMADLGSPTWVEKEFDYENQPAISTGKICGFKKPVFNSIYSGTAEDFGLIVCDTSI